MTAAVAVEGQEVVGFAQMLSDGEVQAHLAADRARRRRGVGRVDLSSEEQADGFYRSFSYRERRGFRIYPGRT